MNRKLRKWIVTERGRLEEKGYRFLTAKSAADDLIVRVNLDFGRTPIPVGAIARDDDAIAWREALALAGQHNDGLGGKR